MYVPIFGYPNYINIDSIFSGGPILNFEKITLKVYGHNQTTQKYNSGGHILFEKLNKLFRIHCM